MIVRCIRECWDSKPAIHYFPGDEADIDPKAPIAKYFKGFPPETEVYFKTPAKKGAKKPTEGFRKISGPAPDAQKAVTLEDMDIKEMRKMAKKNFPEIKGPTNMNKEKLYGKIKEAIALRGSPEALESEVSAEAEKEEED
jgi:hypothetical protein